MFYDSYRKISLKSRTSAPKKVSFQFVLLSLACLFFTCILFLFFIVHYYDYSTSTNDVALDRSVSRRNGMNSILRGGDKSKLKTEDNRGGLSDRGNKKRHTEDNRGGLGDRGNTSIQQQTKSPSKKQSTTQEKKEDSSNTCLTSPSQLSSAERHPIKGKRHIINPPTDTSTILVCCITTAGPLSINVHSSWAPIGAQRFLSMVTSNYFSSYVPLFRCIHNFICQFGLAGTTQITKQFDSSLKDEPNWLPEGPGWRKNSDGVKRFAKGYLAFAGGGTNSRSNQLIVALGDNAYLGGGSPWEVPWGEVVGKASFDTLDRIYTGYGEKGPGQGILRRKGGASKEIVEQFPKMDFINSCSIVE